MSDKKRTINEADIASETMGRNSLQGKDQSSFRNERHAVADVKQDADDLVESFEKTEKHTRAKRDLGKSSRSDRHQ
jgi:hypothetical protein